LESAAENGNLDIIQWLTENLTLRTRR